MKVLSELLSNQIEETVKSSYINCIPLDEFEDLDMLEEFVKVANSNKLSVSIEDEHSNFYQGVMIQLYDKNTCLFK